MRPLRRGASLQLGPVKWARDFEDEMCRGLPCRVSTTYSAWFVAPLLIRHRHRRPSCVAFGPRLPAAGPRRRFSGDDDSPTCRARCKCLRRRRLPTGERCRPSGSCGAAGRASHGLVGLDSTGDPLHPSANPPDRLGSFCIALPFRTSIHSPRRRGLTGPDLRSFRPHLRRPSEDMRRPAYHP